MRIKVIMVLFLFFSLICYISLDSVALASNPSLPQTFKWGDNPRAVEAYAVGQGRVFDGKSQEIPEVFALNYHQKNDGAGNVNKIFYYLFLRDRLYGVHSVTQCWHTQVIPEWEKAVEEISKSWGVPAERVYTVPSQYKPNSPGALGTITYGSATAKAVWKDAQTQAQCWIGKDGKVHFYYYVVAEAEEANALLAKAKETKGKEAKVTQRQSATVVVNLSDYIDVLQSLPMVGQKPSSMPGYLEPLIGDLAYGTAQYNGTFNSVEVRVTINNGIVTQLTIAPIGGGETQEYDKNAILNILAQKYGAPQMEFPTYCKWQIGRISIDFTVPNGLITGYYR